MAAMTQEERRKKQIRAKARRHTLKASKAVEELYKDISEWDEEELARGRPRSSNGTFSGARPAWVSVNLVEEITKRFKDLANENMRAVVPKAIRTVQMLLENDEVDDRGRPIVPAGVKLDAAKWVVEHLVGKPTQRIEADISVRLQALLANVMVNPDGTKAIDVASWAVEDGDQSADSD